MNKKLTGALLAVVAVAAVLYASPYLTLHQIRDAVERKDADALSQHVDFPRLRDNLKGQLLLKIQGEMEAPQVQQSPFAGIGQMLLSGMVSQLADLLVSPSGVLLMLENSRTGKPMDMPAPKGGSGGASPNAPDTSAPDPAQRKKWVVSYRAWSEVLVHPQGEQGGFVLERERLIRWKLVGVELKGQQ